MSEDTRCHIAPEPIEAPEPQREQRRRDLVREEAVRLGRLAQLQGGPDGRGGLPRGRRGVRAAPEPARLPGAMMKRKVTFRRNSSGAVELVDDSWPAELDIAQELLDQAAEGFLLIEGDEISIRATRSTARYRRVGSGGTVPPGCVRFELHGEVAR